MKMSKTQCRICLDYVGCAYKLDDKVQDRFIWEALNEIAKVFVAIGDSYPQSVCWKCFKKLEQSIEFKNEVEKADNVLHSNDIVSITFIKNEEGEFEEIENTTVNTEEKYDEKGSVFEPTITIKSRSGRKIKQKANIYKEEDEPFHQTKIEKIEIEPVIPNLTEREAPTSITKKKKRIKNKKHSNEVTVFRCCMCQDEFQVESDLICHVEVTHQSQIEENLQKSYVKKQTRECKYCKLKFRLMSSLERHANDSNFIEPRRDRSHEYLNRKKRGVTEKTEENVCCMYCGKVLKNKYHLKQHEFRAHAEDLPIACPFPGCEKRFAAKTVLRTHLRIHGEKKHVCDICGRSFLLMKGLIAHKYNHTDKKRYQCAHCPRSFTHKKIILIHIRSHFEEVIFRCNQCEKTYKWENDLKKHIQGAHLGDLPYKCKNCGKGYYCSSSRKYHQDRCQIPIFK